VHVNIFWGVNDSRTGSLGDVICFTYILRFTSD